ncbi:hypothetical protein [Bdellovibrio sp. KM01]|uniref:hypothetical protein n=1 Tax=Bdellovibrio sp. KM01 TaxID=2748865 RepID=UPI0015E905B1|nr:hypothetical protein [Bdellovibrio sp. KM01]QLY25555.1 hypothetical protein HW988_00390 [Bdellovibrio sp. KM01]
MNDMALYILAFLLSIPVFTFAANAPVESDWATTASWVQKDEDQKNPYELPQKSLPPKTTIDTFGICFAASAATVLNYEMCKQGSIKDCSALPESKRVSTLGIARYAVDAPPEALPKMDESYEQLKPGGSGGRVLSYATRMFMMPTEKCVSLQRIASKIPVETANDAVRAQKVIWDDLKSAYEGYRKSLNDKCDTCASKFYATAVETVSKGIKLEDDQLVDPNLRNDQARVLQAFKEDTYEKALNALLYPKSCSENGISLPDKNSVKVRLFPQQEKVANGEALVPQIKEILQSKKPVILDGICVLDCGTNNPSYHSVVIAGYRKICPKGDTQQKNCREALKVINSVGAGWQAAHNDGWVDAKLLMKNVKVDKANLAWLEDRAKAKATQ